MVFVKDFLESFPLNFLTAFSKVNNYIPIFYIYTVYIYIYITQITFEECKSKSLGISISASYYHRR